jgi:hypothetical protein
MLGDPEGYKHSLFPGNFRDWIGRFAAIDILHENFYRRPIDIEDKIFVEPQERLIVVGDHKWKCVHDFPLQKDR